MSRTLWAMVALLIWSAALFLAGRWTTPDRSQEVKDWRDSAQAVLAQSVALEARWAADSARGAAAVARADTVEAQLAGARSASREQQARTAALEVELAQVSTLADTARVQATIIESQRETILGLSVSLEDAQEFLRDARMDLAMAHEDRAEVVAEYQRLQALLVEGVEATKPSRGKLGALDCVVGPGVDRNGFDWASASCGVSIRSVLGRRG